MKTQLKDLIMPITMYGGSHSLSSLATSNIIGARQILESCCLLDTH